LSRQCLLTVFAVVLLSNSALAIKPETNYPQTPSDWRLDYEEITFVTQDSLMLVGWFIPAASCKVSQTTPKEYPTIICVDGDAGNMGYQGRYAYSFANAGLNVLLFDWRGFGKSCEWKMDRDDLVYPEFVSDLDAAIDYLKKRKDIDPHRIGLFGYSTGAYLIFGCAEHRNDIGTIVVRALISTIPAALKNLKEIAPDRELRLPHGYPEEWYPVNAAPRIHCPVFLIVGALDDRSTPEMSKEVYKALPGEKELWIVEGATHGYPQGPEFIKTEEFFKRVIAFFKKHLGKE